MATSAATDLEILAADQTTWIPLQLQTRTDDKGNALDRTLEEALAAADNDLPLSDALEPDVQESWFRGVGLDYDSAPGVDTLDPDYACPSGAATEVTLPVGGAAHIVAIEEYNGNLYVARQGDGTANSAAVIEIAGGSGAPNAIKILGAGEYFRGMVAAQDGSGNVRLYAFSSDSGVQHGRVHAFDGTIWTSSPLFPAVGSFGTTGKGPATTVYWRDRQGIGAQRIVSICGPRKISYTKPNSDPVLPASWVEGVSVGTAYQLTDLCNSRGHVFYGARDNLWDMDEVGNTVGLTSYVNQQTQPGNGDAVCYLDGAVYYSFGRGLIKINVEGDGVLSEQPGQCAPGAYLPVEHCQRGYTTALTTDQGWLVASIFDTTARTCGIFYGKSREQLGIESPNPMIWHGPIVHMANNYRVTRMRTSALTGALRLWVAAVDDTGVTARLFWVSRPMAGTTLQDQYAGGAHRVTTGTVGGDIQPYSRMYMLPKTYGDKASRKDLHQIIVGSRGFDAVAPSQVTVYSRADPDPGSTTWGSGTVVATGPTSTIAAPSVTEGQTLQLRLDFTATSGGATPPKIPYLDSLRTTYWRSSPSTDAWTLTVAYGDGVTDIQNGRDETRSAHQITALLQGVVGRRTTIRDPLDNRRLVRLRQFFQRTVTFPAYDGPYGEVVVATLRLDDLGSAP
jgi:hypothetical protein